jgi:hemoglobin
MSDTASDQPTHYSRIGGAPAVRTAVDQFYDRVLDDPALVGYFDGVDVDRVKDHQVLLIGSLLGGPETYTGRTLEVAHRGLGITPEDYGKVGAHLVGVLESLGAPDDTVAAVKDALASVEPEIIAAPAE